MTAQRWQHGTENALRCRGINDVYRGSLVPHMARGAAGRHTAAAPTQLIAGRRMCAAAAAALSHRHR